MSEPESTHGEACADACVNWFSSTEIIWNRKQMIKQHMVYWLSDIHYCIINCFSTCVICFRTIEPPWLLNTVTKDSVSRVIARTREKYKLSLQSVVSKCNASPSSFSSGVIEMERFGRRTTDRAPSIVTFVYWLYNNSFNISSNPHSKFAYKSRHKISEMNQMIMRQTFWIIRKGWPKMDITSQCI